MESGELGSLVEWAFESLADFALEMVHMVVFKIKWHLAWYCPFKKLYHNFILCVLVWCVCSSISRHTCGGQRPDCWSQPSFHVWVPGIELGSSCRLASTSPTRYFTLSTKGATVFTTEGGHACLLTDLKMVNSNRCKNPETDAPDLSVTS